MSRARRALSAHITNEGHRVTSMELLFDVVYIYAFIQTTTWIAEEFTWRATIEGLVVLGILWWVWMAWASLGNIMRADRGLPLAGLIVSMVAVFGIALTIRGIWEAEGGSLAALTFAALYIVIRVVHTAVYWWGARDDDRLRRQILLTTAAWIPAAVLLVIGAMAPPEDRLFWWAGTLAIDVVATWLLSVRGPGWRVNAGSHYSERFDLMVILALGESVLAVGISAGGHDITPELLGIGLLGVVVAISMWWPYFKDVGPSLENAMDESDRERKADIARDAYSYMHLPLVMGIILAAAGVEASVIALEQDDPSGGAAVLLAAGVALFALSAAALMRMAGGTSRYLLASAIFFAAATLWLPFLGSIVGLIVVIVVLCAVAWITPSSRHREAAVVDADEDSD